MTTELLAPPTSTGRPRIRGFICRNCGRPEPLGLAYVCGACFGPLEVEYDLAGNTEADAQSSSATDWMAGLAGRPERGPL